MLDCELCKFTKSMGLDYIVNDDTISRPFDASPVVVNYFYHEQIKKSARKDKRV